MIAPPPIVTTHCQLGSQLEDMAGDHLPHLCWDSGMFDLVCVYEFMIVITTSCPEDCISQHSLSSSDSHSLSPSLHWCSLSLGGGGNIAVLFSEGWALSTYSQYFDQLYTSLLSAAHCKKKFLWKMLRVAQVYVHKYKYLEDNVIVLPFSKVATRFYPRAYDF